MQGSWNASETVVQREPLVDKSMARISCGFWQGNRMPKWKNQRGGKTGKTLQFALLVGLGEVRPGSQMFVSDDGRTGGCQRGAVQGTAPHV